MVKSLIQTDISYIFLVSKHKVGVIFYSILGKNDCWSSIGNP